VIISLKTNTDTLLRVRFAGGCRAHNMFLG
jgi:hypothetical protein